MRLNKRWLFDVIPCRQAPLLRPGDPENGAEEVDMQRVLFCLSLLVFSLGYPGVSKADLIHTNEYTPSDPSIMSAGGSHSTERWTFDLKEDGFDPATEDVISATVSLKFCDDYNLLTPADTFDWTIPGLGVNGAENAALTLGTPLAHHWEVDSADVRFAADTLISLNADGTLACSLTITQGDAYFRRAILTANTRPEVSPVPEPGSILLLGLGIMGAGIFLRKRQKMDGHIRRG